MLQSMAERTLTLMNPANTETILYLVSNFSKFKLMKLFIMLFDVVNTFN